jgi:hypothetical protein
MFFGGITREEGQEEEDEQPGMDGPCMLRSPEMIRGHAPAWIQVRGHSRGCIM